MGFLRVAALAKALEFAARAGAPDDHVTQLAGIWAAFRQSCTEIEGRPLTGAAHAA